jgi:intraflagellar transport protein 172
MCRIGFASSNMLLLIRYLIDLQTIRILDLVTGITIATVNHDVNIDWLELNETSTFLLFRDKKHSLHLFNVAEQSRSTLLNYCSYVQWVPDSDVVVAQNRSNLCVWYSIEHPERTFILQIKGDVEDIERNDAGRTVVVVDEGINSVQYALDQSLIDFGSSMKRQDFDSAVASLENLELTPETEAMWTTLSNAW